MIIDIFTTFDPQRFQLISPYFLFWISAFMLILIPVSRIWVNYNPSINLNWQFTKTIKEQIKQTEIQHLKASHVLLTTLFSILIFINFWGVIPYTFSLTSHLIFTLILSLPLWLSIILSSAFNNPYNTLATLLPSGAPNWLNPFLIIIETIRIRVRPLTLAFRLAANIRAGHIVLTLIRVYLYAAIFSSLPSTILLLLINTFYLAFELGICLVQAFIFCLLLTLYSNDHQ